MRRGVKGSLLGAAALGVACLHSACAPTTEDLVRAAARGDLALARRCVEGGVDVNRPSRFGFRRENEGDTPLTTAAQFGGREMVKYLISRGADVNLGFGGRADGTSPLSFASARGSVEIARVLLGSGARADARDKDGMSPLAYAVSAGHLEVADLLAGAGAGADYVAFRAVLDHGAPARRIELVTYLLGHGLDANGTDPGGVSFVAAAESKGLPEVAALLRSAGKRD